MTKNLFGSALLGQAKFGSPLNLTGNEEITVGKQGDYDVVIKRFDTNVLLCTKSYIGSVARYVPRGRNFWEWSGFVKNGNATTENFNMITVSNSDYSGLSNPLPASYTPTGWSRSTFPDPSGAGDVMYFYQNTSVNQNYLSNINPATGLPETNWYNTTGGKIGIVAVIVAFLGAVWYAVKK